MSNVYLPLYLILLPIIGALLTVLFGRSGARQRLIAGLTGLGCLLLTGTLFFHVTQGPVVLHLEDYLILGLSFSIDYLSLLFLALFSLTGALILGYSAQYLEGDPPKTRFQVFLLLAFAGTIGVVTAGDFFTLFLFFELMTFSAYPLVIHRQHREAMAGGGLFLFAGIIGGLALLLAILLVYTHTQSTDFYSLAKIVDSPGSIAMILALFGLGFGLKAAAVPLHIWAPKAYTVSPAPANALSSGLLMKTGIYGLIRVFSGHWGGIEVAHASDIITVFGLIVIWLGVLGMLFGAILALVQKNLFTTLAYSSISQIGLVVLGLGTAIYLGPNGAIGLGGSIYHAISHTFFKSALFLSLGILYLRHGSLRFDQLQGRLRQPFLMVPFLISSLGLMGLPGFSAYGSKSILHHALVKAHEHAGLTSLLTLERVFTIASFFSVAYGIKLIHQLIIERSKSDEPHPKSHAPLLIGVLLVFSLPLIILGISPHLLPRIITPMLADLGYSAPALSTLLEINVWRWYDLAPFVQAAGGGFIIYVLYKKLQIDRRYLSPRLSVDYLVVYPIIRTATFFGLRPSVRFEHTLQRLFELPVTRGTSRMWYRYLGQLNHLDETAAYRLINELPERIRVLVEKEQLNLKRRRDRNRLAEILRNYFDETGEPIESRIPSDTKSRPTLWDRIKPSPQWHLENLNTNAFIVGILIVLILIVLFFFR